MTDVGHETQLLVRPETAAVAAWIDAHEETASRVQAAISLPSEDSVWHDGRFGGGPGVTDFVTPDVGHGTQRPVGSECAECHMWLEPGEVYHPWLFCLLWKNGVDDPEKYLRELGYTRETKV